MAEQKEWYFQIETQDWLGDWHPDHEKHKDYSQALTLYHAMLAADRDPSGCCRSGSIRIMVVFSHGLRLVMKENEW